jgi:glycosyltransferase involved in cell wall biosynthesis
MLQDLGFDAPVEVISNGVDVERFRPGPEETNLRDELGLDGRPVVLYTGRLDPEKSMDVWLRAARATVGSCQAQFLVGGQGVDRERLEALAADLELQNHLRFIGYLPADRYPDLYRLADVYCIAAPVELQSISTLEAVSSGVPVVAVKAGALPELVHHEVNGLLVPSGDSRAMSRALVALLNDSDRRVGMGAAGRRLALEHALDRSLDRYESFLSAAAARAGGEKSLERASAGGY